MDTNKKVKKYQIKNTDNILFSINVYHNFTTCCNAYNIFLSNDCTINKCK